MTDTLATFADQVTTVAREVGVEGRLGGQANVPGAAGTWKDLTGNVNLLAANLTTQVRAIAEVATAVTKGDLTRSIQVEARGEVAELKDNINTMIDNLRLTTDRNTEQDWLKTNLARFTGMLQGQRDLAHRRPACCSRELAPLVNAHQGVIYQMDAEAAAAAEAARQLRRRRHGAAIPQTLRLGEGCSVSARVEKRRMLVTDVPPDTVPVGSGLFEALPRNVIVLPVLFEGQVKAVIELASLSDFTAVAPRVPRAAHGQHRHRAQQHRGDDADRRAAQAVAAARRRAADAAEGAAADQRAARAEGAAARRAERRGRAQEPGDRAGAPRARGEGRPSWR